MTDTSTDLPTATASPDAALLHIARQLAHERVDRGLLATLRRFHPVTHGRHSVFETTQVLHAAGVPDSSAGSFQRWAVVVHCLALVRGAHGGRGPGETLAAMRFSEGRLRHLLEADAPLLFDRLPLVARRAAAAGVVMDWWPLAKLLLNAGVNERSADEARGWLARGFIQAQSQLARAPA